MVTMATQKSVSTVVREGDTVVSDVLHKRWTRFGGRDLLGGGVWLYRDGGESQGGREMEYVMVASHSY